jgi:hypothetical protein
VTALELLMIKKRETVFFQRELITMKHFAFILLLVLLSTSAFAQASFDWPQWQGPDRNAISKERGLLQAWPEKGPPLAWKANGIGKGMGGIAVSKGRIYTTGDIDGTAWLFALKETNGELVWKAKIGPGGEVGAIYTPAGPRGTPTVDGDRLYILSQHGELVCFTTEGKEVWRTDLVKDHGGLVNLCWWMARNSSARPEPKMARSWLLTR